MVSIYIIKRKEKQLHLKSVNWKVYIYSVDPHLGGMSKLFLEKLTYYDINGVGGGGGVACDANFVFVYCFLFVSYYSTILLQFCQFYSMGHFILLWC